MRRRGRRKLLALTLLFVGMLSASALLPTGRAAEPALSPALYGLTVVIDAGHGGADPGMVGGSSVEKDINLRAAQYLAEYCRAGGAAVLLTREDDSALSEVKRDDLQRRVQMAQEFGAELFISIHCNSFVSDRKQHGAQLFYRRGSEHGQRLAESVQAALCEDPGTTERSALIHPNSYLLEHLDEAAVICELGFLSNTAEEELLLDDSYLWSLARGIYAGIVNYCSEADASVECNTANNTSGAVAGGAERAGGGV